MKENIKQGSRSGLIFGIILIFIILFGLTTTLSDIFGDFFGLNSNSRTGNTGGLMLIFALLALWAGSQAASFDKSNWKSTLISGASVGLVIGLFIGIFTFLVGTLDAANVEMRDYLVQLNRQSIQFLLYGRSVWTGTLISFGIFLVFSILGGLLAYFLEDWKTGEKIKQRYFEFKGKILDADLVQRYLENPRSRWISYGILLVVVFLIPQFLGKYWNYAMGTVGIYVLMGLGLNIVVGLAGLLDLGYVAFFAIGAYTAGLLTAPAPLPLQIGFWPVLIFSIIMAAFAGILLGIPVLRMRGDYLAIVTLGFGEIIRVLIRSDMLAVIIGAFVLKGLPEILRELDLYRLLVFGGLLVLMMIIRPEGIWPAPRRRMELHEGELDVLPSEESLVGKEG